MSEFTYAQGVLAKYNLSMIDGPPQQAVVDQRTVYRSFPSPILPQTTSTFPVYDDQVLQSPAAENTQADFWNPDMQSSSHLYTEPDSPQLIPSSFSSESPPDSLAWNNKPIPVPNLTKKARGRAVPTKDALLKPGNTGRHFMCTVEDCRKVFTRSEHLKRHTRSIHTNERPFQCDEPDCGKFFTRHDNLLQHQRSHRNSASSRSRNNSLSDTSGPLERIYTSLEPLDPTSSVGSMGILLPSPVTSSPMSYTSVSPLSPHPRQHSPVVDRTSTPASPASPRDFRSTMESGRGFATNHSLGRLDTQQVYYVPAERSPITSRSEAQRFGRSDSEDSMMQQVHISTPLRDVTFFTDR